jgi:endonuclease YncB( thermonuclease family)
MSGTLRALIVLGAVLPQAALAGFTGVVVGVAEGDTLMVRVEDHLLKMHIAGIDAPEPGQPYSERARQSLTEVCGNRPATIDDFGVAKERRIFGRIECDGVDAAAEQVRRGMAWVTTRSAPADSPLFGLQAEARAAERGLWSDPGAQPPWEWSP